MGLAASSLPIRKNGAVVAVEHILNQGEGALLVDETLKSVWGEHAVEGERFGLLLDVLADQKDLVILGVDFHHADAVSYKRRGTSLLLAAVHGPATHHYSHCLGHAAPC